MLPGEIGILQPPTISEVLWTETKNSRHTDVIVQKSMNFYCSLGGGVYGPVKQISA
jgi:hypothetical protein